MPTVLVTGATGFVGRHLCPLLSQAGWEVRPALRRPGEGIVVGDLGPDTQWQSALAGCQAVVHLAARVHVMNDTAQDPLAAFRAVNTAGTLNLARQAAQAGVRRLVFISSIKVNGEQGHFTADTPPTPTDPYGISKWEAEQGLHQIAAETGLEVVILRPPLIYGPGVGANFLALLKLVQRGIPLPFALVNNRRSLVYIGNFTDAIRHCLQHPAAPGKTFLVSDGEDVSSRQLVSAIATAMGKTALQLPIPPRLMALAGQLLGKGPQVQRLLGSLTVDSSPLKETLGWAPPYTLEMGMKDTTEWLLGR